MIQHCTCKRPFQVNSTGPKDTAGLIVSDLHCDGCGLPLSDTDRRIAMIQRAGLERFSMFVWQIPDWDRLDRVIFSFRPQTPLERIERRQRWLSAYGVALGLAAIALSLANGFDVGPARVRAFLIGAGIGALGVLIFATIRQNLAIRRILRQ